MRLKPILHFHIYIHLITLHLLTHYIYYSHQTTTTTSEASTTAQDVDVANHDLLKKILIEHVKANLLKELGLKKEPPKPINKVSVPKAILEEYRQMRDSVRDFIPEDRDYYGKMNFDDLLLSTNNNNNNDNNNNASDDEDNDNNFWDAVHERFGSYNIEVDMGLNDQTATKWFYYDSEDTTLRETHLGLQSEPIDVPPKFEHLLPPHSRSKQGQEKQFISVHLRFNLSQELLTSPFGKNATNEFKGAELRLSREKVNEQFETTTAEHETISLSSFPKTPETTTTTSSTTHKNFDDRWKCRRRPRYQRVYILLILNYDKHNEPITRIHDSKRINTNFATPLVFDIGQIVKYWLENPNKNHGIIVRVTNDDNEFEEQIDKQQQPKTTDSSINLKEPTNASPHSVTNNNHHNVHSKNPRTTNVELVEHVRLKREFRSASESDETWARNQPSIIIYTESPDSIRHHVKREQPNGNNHQRQANAGRQQTKPRGRSKSSRTSSEKCTVKTLTIDFDEVGWSDWVIAPKSFVANYCSGDCSYPVSDFQHATNHAILQSIFHQAGRVVPRPCCAPTKLGEMPILYTLDGGVQIRRYAEMIVEECGCL